MSLILAIVGYFCYAVVSILDKIILTRTVARPIVYTFYSTVISLLAVAALPWVGTLGPDIIFSLVVGVVFTIGLFFLFTAVHAADVSRVAPFNSALLAVFLYGFAFLLLGERLSTIQTAGVALLVTASLLLSRDAIQRGERGLLYAIISAFCFAVAQTALKYLYLRHPFPTVFVWNSAVIGSIGLLFLLHPAIRASLRHRKSGARSPLRLVALDKFLAFIAVLSVEYAISLGSVTIVAALSGTQFAFLFLLVLLLSRFAPKLFREKFTRRGLAVETGSIALILIGLVCISI